MCERFFFLVELAPAVLVAASRTDIFGGGGGAGRAGVLLLMGARALRGDWCAGIGTGVSAIVRGFSSNDTFSTLPIILKSRSLFRLKVGGGMFSWSDAASMALDVGR